MNPWLFPWWGLLKAPWSGDVTQDIAADTRWLSPQFELNFSGNRKIEAEVVAEVASYGKQLGALSEAVLEIAQGEPGDAVERLKRLAAQVEGVKRKHRDRLEQRLRDDLDQLKQQDPEALERLLRDYS